MKCNDTFQGDRCERPAGHDGLHRKGEHVWRFEDPTPAWLRRMRLQGLPPKDMTNAA